MEENKNTESEITNVDNTEELSGEELKAKAEALEAENKELKSQKESEEYKNNQLIRFQKAQEKNQALKSDIKPVAQEKPKENIAVEDLVYLEVNGISKDSEEAKILAKYKQAGLITDYKTGASSVAIKAELDAIKASSNAETVIDENSGDESYVRTSKEIYEAYKSSGKGPEDPKARKIVANKNLENMGF